MFFDIQGPLCWKQFGKLNQYIILEVFLSLLDNTSLSDKYQHNHVSLAVVLALVLNLLTVCVILFNWDFQIKEIYSFFWRC